MRDRQAEGLRAAHLAPRSAEADPVAHRLALVSGKGGVGKSAIAANLAVACARAGDGTLLVDGDAGLANADLLLGLVPGWTWDDVRKGRATLDEAIARGPAGLELLVSGRGPGVVTSLAEAIAGRARGDADLRLRRHTVLDLGAGIGRGVVELATACDVVWLVMTPEPTSLADAYAMARQIWREDPCARVELIVNRCTDRGEAEQAARALQRLTRRFLDQAPLLRAVLPEDRAMGRAVLRQEPVLLAEPASPIARSLGHLAETWREEGAQRDAGAPDPLAGTIHASLPG